MTIIAVNISADNFNKQYRSYDYLNKFETVDEFLIEYLHRDMEYWKSVDFGSVLLTETERRYRSYEHKRILNFHTIGVVRRD